MSAEQKTVLGVALAMRHGVIPPHRHDRELLNFFADQLMEARKREAEVGGNTAKLREAVMSLMDNLKIHLQQPIEQITINRAELEAMVKDCSEALAAPARNCDMGTDEEQADALHTAFIEYCNGCDCPMGCDYRKDPRFLLDANCASILKCFARFALSKATPKEGGAK